MEVEKEPTNTSSSTNNGARVTQNGAIKLPQNCKAYDVSFDVDVLDKIDEPDKLHAVSIIEYCCYQISNKNTDVKPYVRRLVSPTNETTVIYELIVSFNPNTEFSAKHWDDMRALDFERITQTPKVKYNAKAGRQIMTIPINASCNTEKIEDISILIIHLKRKYTRTVVYEYEADDERGSTKRKRFNKEGDEIIGEG